MVVEFFICYCLIVRQSWLNANDYFSVNIVISCLFDTTETLTEPLTEIIDLSSEDEKESKLLISIYQKIVEIDDIAEEEENDN